MNENARRRASLLGGVLGDCLGAPLEGLASKERPEDWELGAPTDDTALTCATCQAYQDGTFEPERVATSMVAFFVRGLVRHPGAATLGALEGLGQGGHWALVGRRGEHAAGVGAAMRMAPLGLVLDPASPTTRTLIRDLSRITHHHEEAYLGALAHALAVRASMQGGLADRETFLDSIRTSLPDSRVRDALAIPLADTDPAGCVATLGSSGFVVEAVPCAIQLALQLHGQPLEAALGLVARLSDDADTIASLTGQILGAAAGPDILPPAFPAWLRTHHPWVLDAIEDFLKVDMRQT